MLPKGLLSSSEGWCAASSVFRVNDGVSYDHSGKQAEWAPTPPAATSLQRFERSTAPTSPTSSDR